MKTRTKIITAVCSLFVIGAVAATEFSLTFYLPNVEDSASSGITLRIDEQCTFNRLCAMISEKNALRSPARFLRAARAMDLAVNIHPGNYTLTKGMNNKQIVRMIARGWQTPVNIVFNGYVRTLQDLAGILAPQIEADSASIATAFLDTAIMHTYGFNPATYPAMFIPNTYEVYWTISPDQLLTRLHKEYEAFWNSGRESRAKEIGLSRTEVSTLASIVIEETKFNSELPRVAGVYMNRLRKGIPLQACPTVKYLLEPGVTRILNRHLRIDSPYNTYIYKGLPPGPITIPPVKAIDAVLNYERHEYMYFCASPQFDGHNLFAKSYSEHVANATSYREAYVRWKAEHDLTSVPAPEPVL